MYLCQDPIVDNGISTPKAELCANACLEGGPKSANG